MVNVSTNESKITINVKSAGTKGSVQAQNDKSQYYEELAKQHEENARVSENNAHIWAEGTDGEVTPLGGVHSSKVWNEQAQAAVEQGILDIEEAEQGAIETLTEKTGEHITELQTLQGTIKEDINTTKGQAIAEVGTTKDNALSDISTAKQNAIDGVDTEANIQKQALVSVSNAEQAKLQGYVNQAKDSADKAHDSEIYCKEVIERIGTAIKIKGRVDTFEDLPKTGNLDGDAYLVGEEGLSSYPEYYWYNNHWEFLGTSGGGGTWGTITGDINAQTDLKNLLDGKQDKLTSGVGIDITNNIISNTQTSAEWGNIQGVLSNQTDLKTALDSKQPVGDYATNARVNEVENKIPSLSGYATESYVQGYHDNTKQDVITDLATIRDRASKGATAYQKPSTGIPKTDLASAVQTSLGKADTAIQSTSDCVKTSGNQTVAGIKTFTGNPVFQGSAFNNAVTIKRNQTGSGCSVRFSNTDGFLGDIGIDGSNLPIHRDASGSNSKMIVRSAPSGTAVGSSSQPVYINSNGVATTCSKSDIASLGFPSNRYIDLSVGASGSTYITPANGYYMIEGVWGNQASYIGLTAGHLVGYIQTGQSGASHGLCSVKAKKGEIMTLTYYSINSWVRFQFIYAEGDQ